jgi:hypothetical protein
MLAAAALGACGGAEAGHASGPTIARWTLQRVATIDPAADSLFEPVVSITADDDGAIYVASRGAPGIHVYDSLGKPLRVLGRPGSGPGEFRRKYSLAWVGDTLAVYDPGNGRIEFMGRDGHWVASQPNARISGGEIRFHQTSPREFFRPSYKSVGDGGDILLLFIRDAFGVTPDTLAAPRLDFGATYSLYCRGQGIGSWSSRYAPQTGHSVSPDGDLITWRTDQYRLTFTRADSQVVRVISYDQPPIPLTDSVWALDLADYQKFRETWSGADCDAGSPRRPETVWLLNAVEFDDQGRAWVEGMQHDSMMLAVYDTAGTQIAAMPAPTRDLDVPYVVRGDRLYEVEADEDGLQKVVVYRFAR